MNSNDHDVLVCRIKMSEKRVFVHLTSNPCVYCCGSHFSPPSCKFIFLYSNKSAMEKGSSKWGFLRHSTLNDVDHNGLPITDITNKLFCL